MKKLFTLLLLAVFASAFAQNYPSRPPLSAGLVLDEVGALSGSGRDALNRKLLAYEDTTSTQIFIYITHPIDDEIKFYATQLAHEWGIGDAEKDNGCLIMVTMESPSSNRGRQIAIISGYGLEGRLTDAMSKRIIENVIIPQFRNGDYYAGLDNGTSAIFSVLAGEFEGTGTQAPTKRPSSIIIIVIVVFMILLFSRRGGGGRGGYYRGGGYWIGGGFGGGGGSSFGGGGGFGGFGGGGFGGGGASGSW